MPRRNKSRRNNRPQHGKGQKSFFGAHKKPDVDSKWWDRIKKMNFPNETNRVQYGGPQPLRKGQMSRYRGDAI